jgi:hypothetical protein
MNQTSGASSELRRESWRGLRMDGGCSYPQRRMPNNRWSEPRAAMSVSSEFEVVLALPVVAQFQRWVTRRIMTLAEDIFPKIDRLIDSGCGRRASRMRSDRLLSRGL